MCAVSVRSFRYREAVQQPRELFAFDDAYWSGVFFLAIKGMCTRLTRKPSISSLVPVNMVGSVRDDGWLQPLGIVLLSVVVAKEVAMSETFRAFLYGIMILATALISPGYFLGGEIR
jgi:hypothetical protein